MKLAGISLKKVFFCAVIGVFLCWSTSVGRTVLDEDNPKGHGTTAAFLFESSATYHHVGNLLLTVTNFGTLGSYFAHNRRWTVDCFTGVSTPSCEFPKDSHTNFLFGGAYWVGGIIGRDTLVTTGHDGWSPSAKYSFYTIGGYTQRGMEFTADPAPFGSIVRRSIMDPSSPEYQDAISEEDFIAKYTDTLTHGIPASNYDYLAGRSHKPLNIEVTQRSYAWSYKYAEDFVLIDLEIKNIGDEKIKDLFFGLMIDPDIYGEGHLDNGYQDDICGFISTSESAFKDCSFLDTLDVAWAADNDGDFQTQFPVTGVIGTRFLGATANLHRNVAFNWYTSSPRVMYDFGPRHKESAGYPFRDFRTGGLGTPEGDRNKYAMMREGGIDYDQIQMLGISPGDPEWQYPPQLPSFYISRGYDIRYVQSIGSSDLAPNQVFRTTIAFIGGENFHHDVMNFRRYLQYGTYYPDKYLEGVDFSSLLQNARWASWVYDNPGVDTDSDGYAGKFHVCCVDSQIVGIDTIDGFIDTAWAYDVCDTTWYEGDGKPDFRGAAPPPAPEYEVIPSVGALTIRWDGFRSETTPDLFSQELDFDGYRVYLGRDNRRESFSMLASYDLENYVKHVLNRDRGVFEIHSDPLTRRELTCLYGDSCNDPYFDPLRYTRGYPLIIGDSVMFFSPQDFNRSEPGVNTPIRKVYPGAPKPIYGSPSTVPDSLRGQFLTEDGHFKYYEYEYTIDNLLPTIPYYVNVTAFDYGSPVSGLGALETPVANTSTYAYALNDADAVAEDTLDVYIYPNPYRMDGDYLEKGYEGQDARYYIPDRLRRIHFANLPAKCTISIYSLDGDLVRSFEHDKDPSDPAASHDTWDLITRNTQAVVSGIYYWIVQEPSGRTQMGKMVIIK